MATWSIPEPGTEYGPCEDGCAHRDCEESRTMAAIPCRICRAPIDYQTPFFTQDDTPVHAMCFYDELDREG